MVLQRAKKCLGSINGRTKRAGNASRDIPDIKMVEVDKTQRYQGIS